MSIHYEDPTITIHHGNCIHVLRELPDSSVDAVCTDPPYGLANTDPAHVAEAITRWVNGERDYLPGGAGFMGKAWDAFVPPVAVWDECLRVLKPGGHVLAFAGSRTVDLMTLGLRLAGFDIRDSVAWLYGSGFPKSLDVSKAIDKAARGVPQGGADPTSPHHGQYRTTTTEGKRWDGDSGQSYGAGGSRFLADTAGTGSGSDTEPAASGDAAIAPDAERWQGWGTAMKPSHEPVCVAVKPYAVGDILAGIGSQLARLESECKRPANDAARSSAPTPRGSSAARTDSAPASAATLPGDEQERPTRTGEAAGSSAQTATSASESTGETCWNTVTSWRECWAELCDLTSTSTTSTTTEATTDLRTLWSSISSLTVTSTPDSPTPRLTSPSTASAADSLFAATVLRLRATLALSAAESATASTPRNSPDAGGGSPAFEPVVVARKPLAGTVAANVQAWGTGALNIDGCRIEGERVTTSNGSRNEVYGDLSYNAGQPWESHTAGRWPANVILDESQAAALDQQSGELVTQATRNSSGTSEAHGDLGYQSARPHNLSLLGETGGASRFFYVAKAGADERVRVNGTAHPTVKPLSLMRWLVRLVTPPGGTVLEPFAGSGTTVEAALLEGFHCIAIEREADYLPLIEARIARRRDPIKAVELSGEDRGLFDLLEGDPA